MKIISDCVINGKKSMKLNRSKILPNSLVQEIENCALRLKRPPSFLFMLFKAFNIAVFTLLHLSEAQTSKTGLGQVKIMKEFV